MSLNFLEQTVNFTQVLTLTIAIIMFRTALLAISIYTWCGTASAQIFSNAETDSSIAFTRNFVESYLALSTSLKAGYPRIYQADFSVFAFGIIGGGIMLSYGPAVVLQLNAPILGNRVVPYIRLVRGWEKIRFTKGVGGMAFRLDGRRFYADLLGVYLEVSPGVFLTPEFGLVRDQQLRQAYQVSFGISFFKFYK